MVRITGALTQGKPQISRGVSLPAPTNGWNARDPLALMQPADAVLLDNWFPTTAEVKLRSGYALHASGSVALLTEAGDELLAEDGSTLLTEGPSGRCETVMEYASGTTQALLVALGSSIYDATSAGAIGAELWSTSDSARFQYVQFNAYLMMVNGENHPLNFNGSVVVNTPSITGSGIVPASFVHIESFKSRLFFTIKDELAYAYLDVNAIGGTATKVNIAPLCRLGGTLRAVMSWTRDSGNGPDDLCVFLTSEGEALIYSGSNPGDANDWSLVGVFRIARPIGRRCYVKYGGDVLIITQDGILPLDQVIPIDRGEQSAVALSNRIVGAVNEAVRLSQGKFGWQPIIYPNGAQAIFNVPVKDGDEAGSPAIESQQFVMNTQTQAWCRFTGINAICWALLGNRLYFGADGAQIFLYDGVQSDNGEPIEHDMTTAYTYMGAPGQLKKANLMRPIINSNGNPVMAMDIITEFRERAPESLPTVVNAVAVWNQFNWNQSNWAGLPVIRSSWTSVTGVGYAMAIRLKYTGIGADLRVISFDVQVQDGGVL